MKNNFFAIGLLGFISTISFAYIPADIEKLNSSDNCQKCDMTEYVIRTGKKESIPAVNLNYSYWTATYLDKVDFTKKSLVGTNFVVSKLFEIIFDESDISDSNFSNSECRNSSFKYTKLKNSNFYKADFHNVQFTNADLSGANLENADFSRSEFMNANFLDANLNGANLSRTNLYGSNITQSQLNSLSFYRCATLPDGSVYDENGEIDCDQ